jgi:sigma-B regulation protein RsbU (phosphoserine phosphatase)
MAVQELGILNEIVSHIGTQRRVDQINRLILGICVRHFNVEQGVIHLLDPTDPQDMLRTGIRVRSQGQETAYQESLRYRLGMSLTGWMLLHQEAVVSNDLHRDERFVGAAKDMPHVRSLLAAPLKVRRRILGTLSLFNKLDARPLGESDCRLLGIIAMQAAQVIENARLYEMEEDLRAAHSIQQGLLPRTQPNVAGVDVYGMAVPAHEVGGDLFDWARLSGGRLGCVVADVSGKGMPAALLMAHLQALFKSQATTGASPAQAVDTVNAMLRTTLDFDRFVTLFCAAVDPSQNTLTYANAGHNPPLLRRADGRLEVLLEAGMLISPISTARYVEHTVPFHPGDLLVVYSDGVTEAENGATEQWGRARLERAIESAPCASAKDAALDIKARLEAFVGGQRQSDDITLVVIRNAGL